MLEPCTKEFATSHGCKKPVGLRWMLRRKPKDGNENFVKARVVAQQVNTGELLDVYAATPTSIGQRIVLWEALREDWIIGSTDISTAFLHARVPDDMYLFASKLASGLGSNDPCDLYWVRQALY